MAARTRKKPSPAPMPPTELGSSGLRHDRGRIREEFDPNLRGRRGAEKFREMRDNSAPVGAALNAIEVSIRGVSFETKPFSKDAADVSRAEHVESCFHDMSFSWADTRSEHLTMIPFGFAFAELVYKRRLGYNERGSLSSKFDDGLVGWAKIPLRGQETIEEWILDEHGGIRGAYQTTEKTRRKAIPMSKALLFRVSRERNNPEGRSQLRNAYWPYFASKRLTESMLVGVQRDLSGFPVIRIPASVMNSSDSNDQAIYSAYKEIIRDIHNGDQAGLILPSDLQGEGGQAKSYDAELLSSGGRRAFDLPAMVSMFDRWIAIVLLSDLTMMGHESVGSFALAKGKQALLTAALDAYLAVIDDVYNTHAIPRLMRLNGWPAERSPRIKHRPVDPLEMAPIADFLSKLTAARVITTPDPDLEDYVRKEFDLPARAALVDKNGRPLPPTQPGLGQDDDERAA